MYGSGFDNPLCLLFCDFFMTFFFGKWCKCTFKVMNKITLEIVFLLLLPSWMSLTKITGSVSRGADPDPYQNVTDPQHWCIYWTSYFAVYIRIVCKLIFLMSPKNTFFVEIHSLSCTFLLLLKLWKLGFVSEYFAVHHFAAFGRSTG